MVEKTSGIYRLVTVPSLYSFFQNALGGSAARKAFREQFFNDISGKRVLEIGCGPGTAMHVLSDCSEYIGIDWNKEHIDTANARYGSERIRFLCGDVSKDIPPNSKGFDYIFAFGILHHLDDKQVAALLNDCAELLVRDGQFLSIDPVYHYEQHSFAKWMCDRDSGQNIRTETGYACLAEIAFENVESYICTDKLRIPYSHCVISAS